MTSIPRSLLSDFFLKKKNFKDLMYRLEVVPTMSVRASTYSLKESCARSHNSTVSKRTCEKKAQRSQTEVGVIAVRVKSSCRQQHTAHHFTALMDSKKNKKGCNCSSAFHSHYETTVLHLITGCSRSHPSFTTWLKRE